MPEHAVRAPDAAPEAESARAAAAAERDAGSPSAAAPASIRPIAGVAGRMPPTSMLALQRQAGNRAVASLLVQRRDGDRSGTPLTVQRNGDGEDFKTDAELIEEAIRDRDIAKVKQVRDLAKAKSQDKISMIDILVNQTWIGPLDEYALEKMWGSFGDTVLDVASKNQDLWDKSLKGGAELYKLPAVKPIAEKFLADTRKVAGDYLDTNEAYTVAELGKLGVMEGGKKAPSEDEQAARLTELTAAMRIAQEARDVQAQLRTVTVGLERRYAMMMANSTLYLPVTFDPAREPAAEDANPPPDRIEKAKAKGLTDEQLKRTPWKDVKAQHDMLEAIMQGLAIAYPAVGIALMAPPKQMGAGASEDPKAVKTAIVGMLTGARDAIRETRPKLAGGLAYELSPIHQQLFGGGKGASGTDWKDPVRQVVAKEVLELKSNVEFWKSMGLATLAAAAFILAEFATAGLATVALVGFGVGLGAGQAAVAWQKALEMSAAEKATTGGGTELLASGQAGMAAFEAALATVLVFVDAFMAIKPVGRALAGAVDRASLAAGTKVATKVMEELAGLAGKAPSRELVERAVTELGAETVIARTGKSAAELIGIVGEGSPIAARLKALAAIPADIAKLTAPELAKRARNLSAEVAANRETAEAIAALAVERFGPKKVLEMNGGWKSLSLALGNESAAGKSIMAWRDAAMADIETFVKTLPGGVDETGKAAVKRTGTQGKFTNDFDVSLLGKDASKNRNAVRSFVAGRFGTSPDRLGELLLSDFFTDPRRLHLYDQLDPLLRAEVGARAEKVAESTIFAKTLHDAEEAGNKDLAQQIRTQMKELGVEEVPFKPLSEGDRSALYSKIDDYHAQLEKAVASADKAAQKDLVGKIGDTQGLINATEGGGYFSGGATRQIVSLAEGLLKGSQKPLDAQVYTTLLDQLPKLNEAASSLLKAGVVASADAVAAIKSIAKYGKRFRDLMAKMDVRVAEEGAWNTLADRLDTLLHQAKGETDITLLARLETDAKAVESEVTALMTEFRASSQDVLMSLSRQAALGGQRVDLGAIQFLVMATAKLTRVSNAVRASLRQIVAQMAEAALAAGKDKPQPDPKPAPPPGAQPSTGADQPPTQRSILPAASVPRSSRLTGRPRASRSSQGRAGRTSAAELHLPTPAEIGRGSPGPAPIVQRDVLPTAHDAAMSGDADKISDVPAAAWAGASNEDRRRAVLGMLKKYVMFSWNDRTVVTILNSYPDRESMTALDIDVIKRAVERGSVKGGELTGYAAVARDFDTTVVERARQNVQKNLGELDEMARKYGIGREAEGGASGIPTAMDELQMAAGRVADARRVQLELRRIRVGWKPSKDDPAGFIPSTEPLLFDPDAQPVRPQPAAGGFQRDPKTGIGLLGQQGIVDWSRVKEAWDSLELQIVKTMATNPALYILASTQALDQRLITPDDRLKFGKSALAGFETTSPEQAKKELVNAHDKSKQALLKIQGKIGMPKDPLERNEIDPASLDELGLHVADYPRFSSPFAKWAASNTLAVAQTRKERIASIIDFATAVVLIGATVATMGGAAAAAVLLTGAATVGAVAGAGVKLSNAADLQATGDAGIRPEDKLTSQMKVSSSELEAGIAAATALLAFAATLKAFGGSIAGLFRRASTAEDLAMLKSGKLSAGRAAKAVQTSIKEVGVVATSEQAGFGSDVYQLHKYLPEGSAEAAEVLEVATKLRAAAKAAGGAVSFDGRPVTPTFTNWTGWHGADVAPAQLRSAGGFQASGANTDLYQHIIAKGEPSAFMGTTAQPLDAVGKGGAGHWGKFAYEIEAGEAWDTAKVWQQNQSALTGSHPLPGEYEISVRGTVPWDRIKGWYEMQEGPLGGQLKLGKYVSRSEWEAAQDAARAPAKK